MIGLRGSPARGECRDGYERITEEAAGRGPIAARLRLFVGDAHFLDHARIFGELRHGGS